MGDIPPLPSGYEWGTSPEGGFGAQKTPSRESRADPPSAGGTGGSSPTSSGEAPFFPVPGEYVGTGPPTPVTPPGTAYGGTGVTGLPTKGFVSGGSNTNPGYGSTAFVPPEYSGPGFDRQGLGSSLASFGAGAVPGAASWQTQLFNPGFNPGEQAFMQSTGDQINRQFLRPGMNRLDAQFSGTPFHSSYLSGANDLMENAGRNLGNVGLQAWMGRQGLAGQAANRIMGSPLDAAGQSQSAMGDLSNLTGSLFSQYFNLPLAAAAGSPIQTPTIVSGGSGSGKKG